MKRFKCLADPAGFLLFSIHGCVFQFHSVCYSIYKKGNPLLNLLSNIFIIKLSAPKAPGVNLGEVKKTL